MRGPAHLRAQSPRALRREHEDWEEDELLDRRLAASGCRGLAYGYARSEVERSRALVVGCNYPRHRGVRLWGACADARAWAAALNGRLGVPERNTAVLADETPEGQPVEEGGRSFPSQRNILDSLQWLTHDARPGDLLVFVFCGRGTLLLDDVGLVGEESEQQEEEEDDDLQVEEALLCADFERADWAQGYSLRMISATTLARAWEGMPRGVSLCLILDSENAASMLPVARRLDSARMPPGLSLDGEPTPVLEAMAIGVARTRAEVAKALQQEAANPPVLDPRRGDRGAGGSRPRRHWLRGQLLWEAATGGEEAPAPLEAEVQAFAFAAAGPGGRAFEAEPRARSGGGGGGGGGGGRGAGGGTAAGGRRGGPAGRRGVLTGCLLQALEELNFQATYYALWWHALRVLRRSGITDQFFQLAFNDGTNPMCREAFEAVGVAEARAFARRSELQRTVEDGGESTHRRLMTQRCCTAQAHEPQGLGPEPPPSARAARSCSCSGPSAGPAPAPQCAAM